LTPMPDPAVWLGGACGPPAVSIGKAAD